MSQPHQPPRYPTIRFIVAWGWLLTAIAAISPLVIGLWAVLSGYPAIWLGVAVVAAVLVWLLVKSYVEVLGILSDTLMPR